jgi:3-phenylpropionate/trans-cinnamate dioxygenase ferredoxin component
MDPNKENMTKDLVKVGVKTDLPEGAVKVITAAGNRVALCHIGDEFFAVADLCSHDGGPLGEGELFDHQIECPRHGARFDLRSGKPTCLPAVTAIPTYKVETRGDEIWVSVEGSSN